MPKTITETEAEKNFLVDLLAVPKQEKRFCLNTDLLIQLLQLKMQCPNQFKTLVGGYSSNTYHYEKENIVFRIPKLHNPLYRHTNIEIHNLAQAKLLGLTPLSVIAYSVKHSLLVTEFIPRCQPYSAANFADYAELENLASLVRKLHYSGATFEKNPESAISFIDPASKTFANIKSILSVEDYQILQKLAAVRNCLATFKVKKRPAHGDLHHFNLVNVNGCMQLMDWELSSIEDPAQDIARFFCVTGLDTDQKVCFLGHYVKSPESLTEPEAAIRNLEVRIQLFEPLNYFSIVLWAKYALEFSGKDAGIILQETVKNYTEKTLKTLSELQMHNVSSINTYIYNETNASNQNRYFSLQSSTSRNDCTVEQNKTIHSATAQAGFKNN